MEERQTNYTIAEGYELPSKGLIYSKPVNPHVELRSMTARDEMKRLGPSTQPLKTLADIIEGCMLEKPAIHVYDMCLGDYEYLLHKLRIVSYGSNYEIAVSCPYCGYTTETSLDLEDLELKKFDLDKYNELRTITLPRSRKTITLTYQTPRIIDTIETRAKELKRRYNGAEIDFETLVKILTSIDTVDGNTLGGVELETFVNNLPALDMQKILNNIDKLNALIGINTKFTVDCKMCHHDIPSFFRIGTEFFRPSNI